MHTDQSESSVPNFSGCGSSVIDAEGTVSVPRLNSPALVQFTAYDHCNNDLQHL